MKQLSQINKFFAVFLLGLLGYYSFLIAIQKGDVFVVIVAIPALLAAVLTGLIGGIIASSRSKFRNRSGIQWQLRAGLNWCIGSSIGSCILPFLMKTNFSDGLDLIT